jgi:hypothetical protein
MLSLMLYPARGPSASSLFPDFFPVGPLPAFAAAVSAPSGVESGQAETSYEWPFPERKDPFFAAALSWFVPGLGQAYVGKPLKGACYWVIDNALFWGAILSVARLDVGLERDIGFRFAVRMRENLTPARVWTSVGLGVSWLAFHIYTVISAAEDANAHNQKILMREMQRDGLALEITPTMGGMSWSYAF